MQNASKQGLAICRKATAFMTSNAIVQLTANTSPFGAALTIAIEATMTVIVTTKLRGKCEIETEQNPDGSRFPVSGFWIPSGEPLTARELDMIADYYDSQLNPEWG